MARAPPAERAIRELKPFSRATKAAFGRLVKDFSERDAEQHQEHRGRDNHDVKAISSMAEVQARHRTGSERDRSSSCTSPALRDVNNLAYALMIAESRDKVCCRRSSGSSPRCREVARRHAALRCCRAPTGSGDANHSGQEVPISRTRPARRSALRSRIAGAVRDPGKIRRAAATTTPPHGFIRPSTALLPGVRRALGLESTPTRRSVRPSDWLAELLDAYARAITACCSI